MGLENTVRKEIEDGGTVLGARASSFSPALVEIYGNICLDFVWLDFEHGGGSPEDTETLTHLERAAELSDIQLLVRLPHGKPAVIRKVLDTGVRNLLVPRVKTAAQVQRAVEAARFEYDGQPGERGIAHQRSSNYGTMDNYVQHEDAAVNIGVMIETREAVDNLSEILSVSELGFVFIGENDLSVQLGHPVESTHSDVQNAIKKIEDECREEGVPLGAVAHSPPLAREKLESGYQILRIGGDFEAAKQTLVDRVAQLKPDDQ